MKKHVTLSASILSADFAYLANEVNAVLAAGVDYIHFDVMDFHYVPNLSFGPVVCQSLRKANITAPIDVHLMVDNPKPYIKPFANAGASLITFHPETVTDVKDFIEEIKSYDMKVGLAVNPDETLDYVAPHLNDIDLILLMSVYPGFSGQSFLPHSLLKIKQTRKLIQSIKKNIFLAVDGGVNVSNIAEIVLAGADFCVLGNGLFAAKMYDERVAEIKFQLLQTSD